MRTYETIHTSDTNDDLESANYCPDDKHFEDRERCNGHFHKKLDCDIVEKFDATAKMSI